MSWKVSSRIASRTGGEPVIGTPVAAAVRAGVFGATGAVLAVSGHRLASGHPVSWRAAALAGLVLFVLALPFVRSPRSLPEVVSATAAAQGALHMWFAHTRSRGVHGSHSAAGGGGPQESWPADRHGVVMTAAHIAAALLVAWCLQRADAAARFAGRCLDDVVAEFLGRPVPPGPLALTAPGSRTVRERGPVLPRGSRALAHSVVRRGPPAMPALAVRSRARPDVPAQRTTSWEPPMSRIARARTARRLSVLTGAVLTASVAFAVPASAHVEVEAEGAAALAENVTLNFDAESESDSAGITGLEVILPEGIAPADITYKEGPDGWKFAATDRGYTVSGPAVPAGDDVGYSVTVRQLPDARSLTFKTLQTYGDGRVDRWIELEKSSGHGHGHGNPAPVLALLPAAPGAKPVPPAPGDGSATGAPTAAAPDKGAPDKPATQGGESAGNADKAAAKKDDSSSPALAVVIVAVVLVALTGAALWWKRRGAAGHG
ncbi:DUF1775 domain-containing protein [Streptomyces sp. NPDC057445]|uniref:DUF1775 domain-containing protein n=1 Tax=Streptomyces sp. NPDC057445 TaxID=3346136 RepID=UPI0036D0DC78